MKELVMEVTNTLPDTATFDDIIEAIYIRLKIENGIIDSRRKCRSYFRGTVKGD